MNTELSVKTTVNDIETKWDKNQNLYFKIYVKWSSKTQVFYAFANQLNLETLAILKEKPEQFINQLVLITYQVLPNQDKGTFYKVKDLQLIT